MSNGLEPILSVLIWVQTVCTGYQQTTKVVASKERVHILCSMHTVKTGTVLLSVAVCL